MLINLSHNSKLINISLFSSSPRSLSLLRAFGYYYLSSSSEDDDEKQLDLGVRRQRAHRTIYIAARALVTLWLCGRRTAAVAIEVGWDEMPSAAIDGSESPAPGCLLQCWLS